MTPLNDNRLPFVYIVFGLPGSGKSYFASRWADMVNARYVTSDKLRKEIYTHPSYAPSEKASVYLQLLIEMEKAITAGDNIVLDATFSDNSVRNRFEDEAKDKAIVQFIEITADESIIRERLKEQRLYSDADYKVYKKVKEGWSGLDRPHLTLYSTHNNINELLRQAKLHFGIKDGTGTPGD